MPCGGKHYAKLMKKKKSKLEKRALLRPALIGGGIGALSGYAKGKDRTPEERRVGAAKGALAGGGIGAGVGLGLKTLGTVAAAKALAAKQNAARAAKKGLFGKIFRRRAK
jgi:hypothetical protein